MSSHLRIYLPSTPSRFSEEDNTVQYPQVYILYDMLCTPLASPQTPCIPTDTLHPHKHLASPQTPCIPTNTLHPHCMKHLASPLHETPCIPTVWNTLHPHCMNIFWFETHCIPTVWIYFDLAQQIWRAIPCLAEVLPPWLLACPRWFWLNCEPDLYEPGFNWDLTAQKKAFTLFREKTEFLEKLPKNYRYCSRFWLKWRPNCVLIVWDGGDSHCDLKVSISGPPPSTFTTNSHPL